MKFVIEQIAIAPRNPARAIEFLKKIGAEEWAHDHVVALGSVYGDSNLTNEADLNFNYSLGNAKEFEVLRYTGGANWVNANDIRNINDVRGCVSHLGMHTTAEELVKWREFMAAECINVAQEVVTESHTNPVIAGKRRYKYVIFDTFETLGVDLKFIVRLNQDGTAFRE